MKLPNHNTLEHNFSSSIFNEVPVAVAIFSGKDYIIEFANDTYIRTLGKTDAIIGKSIFECFTDLKNQGLKEILDTVIKTGKSFSINEHPIDIVKNNTKAQIYLNCTYQVLFENDKKNAKIIVIFSEVTEQITARKLIDYAEKRFDLMFSISPFAFSILKGKEMIVTVANDSIIQIWGKGNDVIGKGLFEILPEVITQGFPKLIDDVFTTGIPFYGYEYPVNLFRNEKLEATYFNFVYQPYLEFDKTISGITLIAYEVTSQVIVKKSIAESEEKFRSMSDLMPVKISYGDKYGNTNYYNQRWIDYTGMSLKQLIDSNWETILHPDDAVQAMKKWNNSLKNAIDFEMEVRYLDNEGIYNWHLSKVICVKNDTGEVTNWIGTNTEIQNQKDENKVLELSIKNSTDELIEANNRLEQKNIELEISRKKLQFEYSRSLIEASLDPLVTINIDGKITDMNQATINITGSSRAELTDSDFFDYFTEPEKAREVYKKVFANGSVADSPLTLKHKNGKLTDVLFNGSIYKDEKGNVIGVVIVARDVTEQKIISNQLNDAKAFAEIATSIAEEAQIKAEGATRIAVDSVKAKQQFLSNMSHEIRTPMNAIIGFTKVVLKTDLNEKQKEYLTAIKTSGDALIVLINDILDLAKVDSGKMSFEQVPFKMAQSIAAMIHIFDIKSQEKNLQLLKEYDTTIPDVLVGDPVRLHQIILNLVSNAIKFTNYGKITLNVKIVEDKDDIVLIEFAVSDTGIGIPENKIDSVFENFQQASSGTSRLFGGTGLGLAIVKQLVEGQGGKINVKSVVNEGSTFSFTLPFTKTSVTVDNHQEIVTLETEMKDIKVLVVEDIALNQLLMRTLLEDFGFSCDIAANGQIAVDKLQANVYDIILMDLQMPVMNGFEATEYIRNTLNSSIPIIALTADVTTVDVAKCKAVGMNDYVSKPVDERLLYSKITGIVTSTNKKSLEKEKKMLALEIKKCIDLNYLMQRTKSNPALMSEMISLYLEQTPPLIASMRKSYDAKDWTTLYSTVHKMIPSFSIVGIHQDFENMAKKIQEFASEQVEENAISDFISQLENICNQACIELQEELHTFKKI